MSADRLTESDSLPDRGAEADKPFPGGPTDREPASAPGPAPSMDQMREAYANAGSARDIEASAKADEAAAARGSDTGTAEPGVPATGVPESAAVVSGTVVHEEDAEGASAHADGSALADEVSPPEEAAGPERTDSPAFPGAPPDREPVPAPGPAPSMEQMREAFARSSNGDELQANAKADEAAAKETPAEKGTAAAKPGGDAAASRDAAAAREPAAGDGGEQQGEESDSGAAEETTTEQPVVLRAPQQEMPAAEAPEGEPAPLDGGRTDASSVENQPDATRHEDVVVLDQGEDAEAESAAEGIEPTKEGVVASRSDTAAPEVDDKPVVAGVVEPERPEAGVPTEEGDVGDTNARRSEVRLDSQSDDQRPVTHADLDALEARYKAEMGSLTAENHGLKEKLSELEGQLDAVLRRLRSESGQASERGEQAGPGNEEGAEAPSDGNEHPPDDMLPPEGSYGQNFTWTTLPPEGRAIDETSPTGIGRKPDGDQLLDRENDKRSRSDRIFGLLTEKADDVSDASDMIGGALKDDFTPPTASAVQPVAQHGHPVSEQQATTHTDPFGSTLLTAVAVGAGIKYLVEHRRNRES